MLTMRGDEFVLEGAKTGLFPASWRRGPSHTNLRDRDFRIVTAHDAISKGYKVFEDGGQPLRMAAHGVDVDQRRRPANFSVCPDPLACIRNSGQRVYSST